MAPLELLGFLPRPPKGDGEGVAKLLNGELLAYASASSVCVVDVRFFSSSAGAALSPLSDSPFPPTLYHRRSNA